MPDVRKEGVCRAPMADDGYHLMCHSHGALYRPNDGLCILGPCYGQRLCAIPVEEDGDRIVLVLDQGPW
jgi:nitrite reductase/ring-hydroxylating ferredoxin subunit